MALKGKVVYMIDLNAALTATISHAVTAVDHVIDKNGHGALVSTPLHPDIAAARAEEFWRRPLHGGARRPDDPNVVAVVKAAARLFSTNPYLDAKRASEDAGKPSAADFFDRQAAAAAEVGLTDLVEPGAWNVGGAAP